jgi:hypothetical protein
MTDASSSASSSSASGIEDIVRLIPAHDRAAFSDMLQHEVRGRELPDDELRRVAGTHMACIFEGWLADDALRYDY